MKQVILLSGAFFAVGCALLVSQNVRSWQETNFIAGLGMVLCISGIFMPLILSIGSKLLKWLKK